jgi:hypothetical protein
VAVRRVQATATSTINAWGVFVNESTLPTVTGITGSATAANSYGLLALVSTVVVTDSTLTGSSSSMRVTFGSGVLLDSIVSGPLSDVTDCGNVYTTVLTTAVCT